MECTYFSCFYGLRYVPGGQVRHGMLSILFLKFLPSVLQFSLGLDGKKLEPESNVLLASIENMQYAVTLDVLYTVTLFFSCKKDFFHNHLLTCFVGSHFPSYMLRFSQLLVLS